MSKAEANTGYRPQKHIITQCRTGLLGGCIWVWAFFFFTPWAEETRAWKWLFSQGTWPTNLHFKWERLHQPIRSCWNRVCKRKKIQTEAQRAGHCPPSRNTASYMNTSAWEVICSVCLKESDSDRPCMEKARRKCSDHKAQACKPGDSLCLLWQKAEYAANSRAETCGFELKASLICKLRDPPCLRSGQTVTKHEVQWLADLTLITWHSCCHYKVHELSTALLLT